MLSSEKENIIMVLFSRVLIPNRRTLNNTTKFRYFMRPSLRRMIMMMMIPFFIVALKKCTLTNNEIEISVYIKKRNPRK